MSQWKFWQCEEERRKKKEKKTTIAGCGGADRKEVVNVGDRSRGNTQTSIGLRVCVCVCSCVSICYFRIEEKEGDTHTERK